MHATAPPAPSPALLTAENAVHTPTRKRTTQLVVEEKEKEVTGGQFRGARHSKAEQSEK